MNGEKNFKNYKNTSLTFFQLKKVLEKKHAITEIKFHQNLF